MKNSHTPTDTEMERSQAFLGAVLGVDEEGNLPPDRHQIGANNPPEPVVAPEDKRIADLVANADKWAEEHPVIEDDVVGDEAANWLKQLNDHLDEFEDTFKQAKAPHEEKLAEIRALYHPRIERLKICKRAINPLVRAWIALKEQRRKAVIAAEERKAAEAQRRADQLTEQAQAGGPNAVSRTIAAMEAAQEAERARQAVAAVPKRAQVRGTLGGPALSLRTVWRAEIVEWDECYQHFKNHTKVKELLQSLANEAARTLGAEATRLRRPKPAMRGFEIYSTQE